MRNQGLAIGAHVMVSESDARTPAPARCSSRTSSAMRGASSPTSTFRRR
jgi:hypothetical protein